MMPATCSCVSSFRFCPAGKNSGLTALPRTRFCATSEPETGRSGSGSLRRRCRRTPSTARMRCHCSPAISKNGVPLWAPAAWMRMRTRVKVPGIFARAASGSLAVMRPRARPACGGQLNPPPPSSSPQRSCCHQDGDAGSRAPAAGPSSWRARPRHRSPPPHSRPDGTIPARFAAPAGIRMLYSSLPERRERTRPLPRAAARPGSPCRSRNGGRQPL